jgi:hypothetical protein
MKGNRYEFRHLVIGIAALTAVSYGTARAGEPAEAGVEPVVVAQVSTSTTTIAGSPDANTFPAYQAKVRAAAAQGPDALRRYVHRTRMIYNFYYNDFAPKQ